MLSPWWWKVEVAGWGCIIRSQYLGVEGSRPVWGTAGTVLGGKGPNVSELAPPTTFRGEPFPTTNRGLSLRYGPVYSDVQALEFLPSPSPSVSLTYLPSLSLASLSLPYPSLLFSSAMLLVGLALPLRVIFLRFSA